jgi:hypothetical protein
MVGDGAQGHARALEAIADGRRRLLRPPDEGFGIDFPILRNLNGWLSIAITRLPRRTRSWRMWSTSGAVPASTA